MSELFIQIKYNAILFGWTWSLWTLTYGLLVKLPAYCLRWLFEKLAAGCEAIEDFPNPWPQPKATEEAKAKAEAYYKQVTKEQQ